MSSTSTSQAGYTMPTLSITTLFTLALFFTQVAAQGWILPQMPQLGVFRMDPIVNPGAVSSHVHNVVGASRFDNVVRDPSYNQGSTCSSISLQADKSMYWAPQLYYRREDNTYTPMMGNSRIYYFIKGDNVQPFPPNLRMLSGTPMKRNLSDVRTIGLGLSCSGHGRGHFLPNSTTFPNGCGGLSLGIFFPSCGLADGSLDSDDHASHMTWPVTRGGGGIPGAPNPNNGDCPKSHPIKYPTIFMEHNYYFGGAQPWRNEPNLIVLSNGDALGSSYHGDFINGWDQGVLSSAIKGCRTSDNLAACSMFKPHINNQAATECRLESKIPAENVGLNEPLKNLPGCNPLWTANMGDKPTCDRAPAEPGFVYPNAYFNNLQYGSRWPIADPRANASLLTDRFRPDNYISLAPTWMGKPNESAIKKWGAQAFNKVLQVGTIPQILAAWVGNDGIKGSQTGIAGAAPVGSASAGAASASASQSSTTSKATSQSSASAASTSSSSYSDDDDGWYSTSSQLPSATKNAVIIGQPSSLPKASGSVKNLATAAPSPSSAASVKSTASASATSSVAALVKNIASASLKPSSAASGKSTVSASATTSKASSASSVKSTGTAKASSASSAARAASSGTAKPTSAGTSCKRSSKKRSAHSKRRLNMEKRRHTARFAE